MFYNTITHTNIIEYMYLPSPTDYKHDVTQGQFLSQIQQV